MDKFPGVYQEKQFQWLGALQIVLEFMTEQIKIACKNVKLLVP